MHPFKTAFSAVFLCLVSLHAAAITNDDVFAYAEAHYPSIFRGISSAGQYFQYSYRYYPGTGNYLGVDNNNVIHLMGVYTQGVITPVGPVSDFVPAIIAWKQEGGSRFVKVDNSGYSLPLDAATWTCTRDTSTGLLWEVKTDDGGLRDKDWVYTAYEATGMNGNNVCDASKTCNQFYFRDAVNAVGLCGYRDWRLPSVTELEKLQDPSQPQPPYINQQFFPNTKSAKYWTGSGYSSGLNQSIWWVDFATVYSASTKFKDIKQHVRLVRP
jgi:hypothetical protein